MPVTLKSIPKIKLLCVANIWLTDFAVKAKKESNQISKLFECAKSDGNWNGQYGENMKYVHDYVIEIGLRLKKLK